MYVYLCSFLISCDNIYIRVLTNSSNDLVCLAVVIVGIVCWSCVLMETISQTFTVIENLLLSFFGMLWNANHML